MRDRLLLLIAVFVASDLIAGAVARALLDPPDAGEYERSYRTGSPRYHHDLLPGLDTQGAWGAKIYPVHTNSLGFRAEAVESVALEAAGRRVLFIGDSFTEGVGLAYERTFVGRIDRALAFRGVDVLNAAAVSYSPSIYRRKIEYLLEERGLEFDALYVMIDVSDIYDEARIYDVDSSGNVVDAKWKRDQDAVRAERQAAKRRGLRGFARRLRPIEEFVRDTSLTLRLTRMLRDARRPPADSRFPPGTQLERSVWTVDAGLREEWGNRGLARAREQMTELAALARRRGVELTVGVYPWPDQIVHRDLDSLQVRFWSAWAREQRVGFWNLFPLFIDGADVDEALRAFYIAGDVHWNARGHQRVAEDFLRRFERAGQLPAVAAPAN